MPTEEVGMPSEPLAMSRRALLQAGALSLVLLPNQARAAAEPALNVQRFGLNPTITPLGIIGGLSQYDDQISMTKKGNKALSLNVQFEFPSQWAQLQRQSSITYVDQSTGLKTYVLKALLPEGTTLATVPKAWFGEAIFSEAGAIVKSGTIIEDYKVSSSKIGEVPEFKLTLQDDPQPFTLAPGQSPVRRRLGLKYSVVTPANQRVTGRKGVVDAYEVSGVAYMLVATAGDTKWEGEFAQGGSEKTRCERTADSFRISAGL